jgi:hypothetical protein
VGIAWSTEQRMLPSARMFLEHAVREVGGEDTSGDRQA